MDTSPQKNIAKYGIGVVVVVAVIFVAYVWVALTWSYSTGERAGFLQKMSHKGWLCKTWEGELSMVAMPGASPEKFFFTVRNPSVAEQINKAMGKRVTLLYSQHKGVPTSCFGETEYFVEEAKEVAP
jgi:hypothetical protein